MHPLGAIALKQLCLLIALQHNCDQRPSLMRATSWPSASTRSALCLHRLVVQRSFWYALVINWLPHACPSVWFSIIQHCRGPEHSLSSLGAELLLTLSLLHRPISGQAQRAGAVGGEGKCDEVQKGDAGQVRVVMTGTGWTLTLWRAGHLVSSKQMLAACNYRATCQRLVMVQCDNGLVSCGVKITQS